MQQQLRGSDVFLKPDVDHILQALALTAQDAVPGEYNRGYRAALAAVAVALGIPVLPYVPEHAPFRT